MLVLRRMNTYGAGMMGHMTHFLVLIIGLSAAVASGITLQQGVNGYSGCSDSFIVAGGYSESRSQNFGHTGEIRIACSHYASW
jgi:hypothetical protein